MLVAVTVGALAGSAESAAVQECRRALIISTTGAKVLRGLQLSLNGVVADGQGGWFVANSRLQRLHRDGSVDRAWRSPVRRSLAPRQPARAGMLARQGDRLYVAGRLRVVAVDAGTGRVIWRSPAIAGPTVKGFRPTITAVAAGSRSVYVGGTFTSLGGAERVGLAALDAFTGRLLPWRAPPVRGLALLALSTSRLYFSGSSGVGAVRAGDGRPTGFVPQPHLQDPLVLAAWRRFLLVGCSSRWSSCNVDSGVFDARTGKPVHKYGFGQVVSAGAIAIVGSTAYLGAGPEGSFGGDVVLIAINLRTGKYEPWFPKVAAYSYVESMAVSGERVFVAGSFCPS